MATQSEKLAKSLEVLERLQEQGRTAIQSRDLTRTHRERLLAAGFLQEVMKGWYIGTRPELEGGRSTSWYVSYWGFCADYLKSRLGDDWCLSPEQSLLLHAGNRTIPRQLIVRSGKGSNNLVSLPNDTALLPVRASIPARSDQIEIDGLRLFSIAAALIAVDPGFFMRHPTEARTALAQISSASEILPPLLEKGQTTIAGRLAGAFKNVNKVRVAEDIVINMQTVGHPVRITDPFSSEFTTILLSAPAPPHVHRLRLMWMNMRTDVLTHFPPEPSGALDTAAYLSAVEDAFVSDAYHSLSIEGYQVSQELIERVRAGDWAPDAAVNDRNQRDAMAAKGYWHAFQSVQGSLQRVFDGETPGLVAKEDHSDWYRELFAPSVTAGIVRAGDLAGYRNDPVYISKSRFVPPRAAAVKDLMPAFFNLLTEEESAPVRVVLGHFVFVNIHPYLDGNGRMGRFLMNLMLAGGGYPWIVIPVEKRSAYLESLETASIDGNVIPFTRFLGNLINPVN